MPTTVAKGFFFSISEQTKRMPKRKAPRTLAEEVADLDDPTPKGMRCPHYDRSYQLNTFQILIPSNKVVNTRATGVVTRTLLRQQNTTLILGG